MYHPSKRGTNWETECLQSLPAVLANYVVRDDVEAFGHCTGGLMAQQAHAGAYSPDPIIAEQLTVKFVMTTINTSNPAIVQALAESIHYGTRHDKLDR